MGTTEHKREYLTLVTYCGGKPSLPGVWKYNMNCAVLCCSDLGSPQRAYKLLWKMS